MRGVKGEGSMRAWLLDVLVCPDCPDQPSLRLEEAQSEGEEILSGRLTCSSCGKAWPVRDGIPRFVPPDDDYCGNFGFQWREWQALQIDRLSGHTLSRDRFMADSGWPPGWLSGKLILDAGCGAGRFTDVCAGEGARVVACDLSGAIDACAETMRVHQGRVACIQASLFALPLRRAAFDGLFCMGVIQHTPDPDAVIAALPQFLRPEGRLAYNFYERDWWPWFQVVKYALRLITPRLSLDSTLALSRALVALFFPLTHALSGIRRVRIINHVIPIASVHSPQLSLEQQRAWTLLDTFDWYGPRYEKRQDHREVAARLRAMGLDVRVARAGIVQAFKATA